MGGEYEVVEVEVVGKKIGGVFVVAVLSGGIVDVVGLYVGVVEGVVVVVVGVESDVGFEKEEKVE